MIEQKLIQVSKAVILVYIYLMQKLSFMNNNIKEFLNQEYSNIILDFRY